MKNAVAKQTPAKTTKSAAAGGSFFNKHHRALILLICFVLPILIYLTVLLVQGLYPFGTQTTLYMDLKDQYIEFLSSLRYIGDPDKSLLFSWSRSMGGNSLGLYAYYSGGLLSFISCLFPVSMMYTAAMFIQILEIGLCGLSFGIFLEFGPFESRGNLRTILFAVAYALMSYNMVYLCCFMWLTGCVFLPLCMLGIEKILAGKRGALFYICLAMAMIFNYYTAYMICLFSILYFVFRVIGNYDWSKQNRKESFKKAGISALKYGGCGIGAALTAMPVLLPVYLDLTGGKLAIVLDRDLSGENFDFFKVFGKLLPGQFDSITNQDAMPSLYTGIICLLFVVVLFFCKKIKISERITALLILLFLLFCFWLKLPDWFWHGMQFPNWFPYRYAFVFGFFMVYLAARSYDGWVHIIKKIRVRNVVTVCLIAVISVELFLNARYCTAELSRQFLFIEKSVYDDFINKTEPLIQEVKEQDDSLYRVSKDYEFSKNDAMLLGYNGMTHYSSTYNAHINHMTSFLGLAQIWYWNSGYGATPFVDSLFGVKYRLNQNVSVSGLPDVYEKMDEKDGITLSRNPYALPFAFAAEKGCENLNTFTGDVFSNQNTLMQTLTGRDSYILSFYEFERNDAVGESQLTFVAANSEPVYMYLQPNELYGGQIFVNDQYVTDYFTSETTCVVYLGMFSPGETVKVSVRSDNSTFGGAWIADLNLDEVKDVMRQLQAGQMNITSFGAGDLEGEITLKDGQTIATTIPYDEGYTVLVDGEPTEYTWWMDSFIAIPASPGTHTVSIRFLPQGFSMGLIAAGVALLLMLVYLTFPKWKRKVFRKKA